jgi:hypothetical protein
MTIMKNSSALVLLLAVLGTAALIASSLYFGSPLFGWLIIAAIFVVFIGSEVNAIKGLREIEKERQHLTSYSKQVPRSGVEGTGIVVSRIRLVQKLSAKGMVLNPQVLKDILDAREEIKIGKSSGGVVILLGLMGTFFGLMLAVSTAGNSIELNSAPESTLSSIQAIFSSMKGIFGTSLCGLFAAIVLNASHSILVVQHTNFMMDLDEFTLFELLPDFSVNKNDATAEIRKLVDSIANANEKSSTLFAEQLKTTQSQVLEGMLQVQQKSSEALQNTLQGLSTGLQDLLKVNVMGVEQAQKVAIQGLQEAVSSLSSQMESLQKGAATGMQSTVDTLTRELSTSLKDQVKSSGEQWKQFMDSLGASATNSENHQREGLETLRSVALQVAEKAEAGSVDLSKSVADQIRKLSEEVQSSFRELSTASAALVQSQQALIAGIENRVVKENETSSVLASNITDAASLMRVNQSEFSANLEMFREGIEAVLEKLSGDSSEHDEEQNFIEQLHLSLEAFHERASEVLVENAMKTQEILLEILQQSQHAPASENKAEA